MLDGFCADELQAVERMLGEDDARRGLREGRWGLDLPAV